MDRPPSQAQAADHLPLISNRFLHILTAIVASLAILSGGISLAGRWMGEQMSLAGHTGSSEIFVVTIGQDRLRLMANTMRFEEQRKNGVTERVDLYFLWPEMKGYSKDFRARFDDLNLLDGLIFVQLTQSTMSRDMSGRVEPIYQHLFDGPAEKGPHGLVLHHLKSETGYGKEVLLTAPQPGQPDYAVRCIMPDEGAPTSSGDCQRDIHVGRDLTVLYRFSSKLLGDWNSIDQAIRAQIEASLRPRAEAAPQLRKIGRTQATNDSS